MRNESKNTDAKVARWLDQARNCEAMTFDAWATTVFSRFQVPTNFERLGGAFGLLGSPTRQFCNEPVLLLQSLLGIDDCGDCSGNCGTNPQFLKHCMTHNAPDLETFLGETAFKFGSNLDAATVAEFEKVIRLEANFLAAFRDVPAALTAFENLGLTLNLVSNLWQFSAQAIMELPIGTRQFGDFFKAKILSFQEKKQKPDVGMFNAIERDSFIPLDRQIMVGDDMKADINGSLAAGFALAVLVDRNENLSSEQIAALDDRVLYVTTLSELVEIMLG